MFEKWKENWKNRKIQQHFEENKDLYICVGVGIAGGWILRDLTSSLHPARINNSVAPVINPTIAPVMNNVVNNTVNNLGRPPYLVHNITDNTWHESQGLAAKALGVSDSKISEYFKGTRDHINGKQLERFTRKH